MVIHLGKRMSFLFRVCQYTLELPFSWRIDAFSKLRRLIAVWDARREKKTVLDDVTNPQSSINIFPLISVPNTDAILRQAQYSIHSQSRSELVTNCSVRLHRFPQARMFQRSVGSLTPYFSLKISPVPSKSAADLQSISPTRLEIRAGSLR